MMVLANMYGQITKPLLTRVPGDYKGYTDNPNIWQY